MEAPDATLTPDGRMVTNELAEWVADLSYDDLPTEVVEEASRVVADFLGETLFVGATKPWGQAIAAFCAVDGAGRPESTIIATGAKVMASKAALANGTMALGFEYADFGGGGRPYPFSVTGPLALAEAHHKSGRDLILSIAISYEVMARLMASTMPFGTKRSVYVPALMGTVGSAAACARMLGLSTDHTNYALGLGAAFTGGTFQGHEEGAWQRSLNGGMASERGVNAALLAATGFKATQLGLEGVQGFAAQWSDGDLDPAALLDGLGESWAINRRWVKPYPMNLTLHAPVEALLQVMRENDLDHTDIEQISAAWQKVEPFLAKHKVSTVVAAQASLPFALAVASVRGKVDVDSFTEEMVADPVIQGLVHKTVVYQDTDLMAKVKGSMPSRVTVTTTDGRELTAEVLYPKGNPANPLTEEEFRGKFMNMAVRVLGEDRAGQLYDQARGLDGIDDMGQLMELVSPEQ
jgi:2-methylcitrate dehydratase